MREPAAKVFSQYVHLWSAGRETLPFEAAFAASEERRARGFSDMFDYAGGGYYAAAVARFLERFGPERVLVLLFEELTADMAGARARLEAFLGTALPPLALPRINAGGRVRSPIIAALLGNERLKGALRGGAAARAAHPAEQRPARRASPPSGRSWRRRPGTLLRRRYAADAAELARLIGRPTGWPAA